MKTLVKLIRLVYLAIAFLVGACGTQPAPRLVVDGIERGKWEVLSAAYKPIVLAPDTSWLMVTAHIEGIVPESIRVGDRVTATPKLGEDGIPWRAEDNTVEPVNGKLAIKSIIRFYWTLADDYTGPIYVLLDGEVIGESAGFGLTVLP